MLAHLKSCMSVCLCLLQNLVNHSALAICYTPRIIYRWSGDDHTMSGVNCRTTLSFETGKLHLACGGLETGEAKHFRLDYLINLLPPSFHIPEMKIQLRNTKMTLAIPGLEANNDVNGLGNYANSTTTKNTNPVYDSLRGGLQGGSRD